MSIPTALFLFAALYGVVKLAQIKGALYVIARALVVRAEQQGEQLQREPSRGATTSTHPCGQERER